MSSTVVVHPQFDWIKETDIPSLGVKLVESKHRSTGMPHYHLLSDQIENVFLIGFRTIPEDSSGVAHILEHTVLCGSEKYPVRDPFFLMLRRSLNTFMNAFTSSDWTAYPFATQNKKDYFNLLSVYLDAVFFSKLDALDFAQEGHRLEFTEPNDATTPLMYRGVVYNEMKGAMSSASSTLYQTLTKYLYPTITYHHNSGGEPEHITDLTHEGLLDFYKTHYHPSNAILFTFGSFDLIEQQTVIHDWALKRFQQQDVHFDIPIEKRYFSPVVIREGYPVQAESEMQGKTHVVLGWLLPNIATYSDQLEWHLINEILLGHSGSVLRKALETSSLGASPSPILGLMDHFKEPSFACGLQGCDADKADDIEKMIIATLQEAVEKGFSTDIIEAALHQIEISQREISGDNYPYGLELILEGFSAAVHRRAPEEYLNVDAALEKLRQKITSNPKHLTELLREGLINNPHRVRLTLEPDAQFNARKEQWETQQLQLVRDQMSKEACQHLVQQAQSLTERQKEHVDSTVLPEVTREDIPEELHFASGKIHSIKTAQKTSDITTFDTGTNGLVYLSVFSPIDSETLKNSMPWLGLVPSFWTRLGAENLDYEQMQHALSAETGGMKGFISTRHDIDDLNKYSAYLGLSIKALSRKFHNATDLMAKMWSNPRFDAIQRLEELFRQRREGLINSVTDRGHSLAMDAASAGFSTLNSIHQTYSGLQHIQYMKTLDTVEKRREVLDTLSEFSKSWFSRLGDAPSQWLWIGETEHQAEHLEQLQKSWQPKYQTGTTWQEKSNLSKNPAQQAWLTDTKINFCAQSYPAVPFIHPDSGALAVLAPILRHGYLHSAIREQGGAYGGGASFSSSNGSFSMYSYRDPRLTETFEDFERALEWIQSAAPTEQMLNEAVLSTIASIDKPGSPAGEARSVFINQIHGKSVQDIKNYRQQILEVTLEDVKRVAAHYLSSKTRHRVVITDPIRWATKHNLKDFVEITL
ncbi:MAG: insulinase family protein [Pseudomonadota bacterium]